MKITSIQNKKDKKKKKKGRKKKERKKNRNKANRASIQKKKKKNGRMDIDTGSGGTIWVSLSFGSNPHGRTR